MAAVESSMLNETKAQGSRSPGAAYSRGFCALVDLRTCGRSRLLSRNEPAIRCCSKDGKAEFHLEWQALRKVLAFYDLASPCGRRVVPRLPSALQHSCTSNHDSR